MNSLLELAKIVTRGNVVFKQFITEQIKRESDFLERLFWHKDARQMTVLNYLIDRYIESDDSLDTNPLVPLIDYTVSLMNNKNVGAPLHQAISAGKINLALHLLKKKGLSARSEGRILAQVEKANADFDVNERDDQGKTLLYLTLTSKNESLLAALLAKRPRLHDVFYVNEMNVLVQGLHYCVLINYPQGIRALIQQGAQLSNPCTEKRDTPVLLAARVCAVDALEALLECPIHLLAVEVECSSVNDNGYSHAKTAIELLCMHLNDRARYKEALKGIAMLLSRGAKPPRSEAMRQLVSTHREELLKAIHQYLEDKPDLVDDFVDRCHSPESALHNILYAPRSLSTNIRYLCGAPSTIALNVEQLVIRKYTAVSAATDSLPTAVAEHLSLDTEPAKLYAMFVKRYTETYNNQLFANPWSKMRFLIADGQGDWDKIQRYVETNPNSRSALVYKELFKPLPELTSDEKELTTELDYGI